MVSSWDAKERMEFYPDRLPDDVYSAIEADLNLSWRVPTILTQD